MLNWMWKVLIIVDTKINDKWLGGRNETISGRCYRSECRLCKWLCRGLSKVDPDHCKKAFLADRINHPDLPI